MKNKKILAVLAAMAFVVCAGASASGTFGIGVQGGYIANDHGGGDVAVTFKIPHVPPVFAVNVGIWNGELHRVGATADWWLGNPNITGVLNWFYGPGLAVGASHYSNNFGFYAGGRFVVGLNAFVVDFLEIYAQVAAQLGIETLPNVHFDWGFPINAGIRFWF